MRKFFFLMLMAIAILFLAAAFVAVITVHTQDEVLGLTIAGASMALFVGAPLAIDIADREYRR